MPPDRRTELLLRAKTLFRVKESLTEWCQHAGFEPAEHHRLIIAALERLESGEGKRKQMVFMPPGAAKSTYGSVLFAPWFLARNPYRSVIAASHSEELAERFGRRVRNLIDEHEATLGISLSLTNRAAGRWQLAPREGDRQEQMGEYLSAGVGSQIQGFRADVGIIDDPVKGREEAASETQRQKTIDWYRFDFRPRLKPHARQLVILTRWHEYDLAGAILDEEGDEWDVLSLPMLSEGAGDPLGRPEGERLWKEWFTDDMVREAQRDVQLWLSLYQQRPTAPEGDFWKLSWLHAVSDENMPPRSQMRIYGASDYATTADGGDYTVHVIVGLDASDRPWLLDLWRERTSSDVWVEAWCSLVKWWKPLSWAEESGQILAGVGPFLERIANERHAYTDRQQFPTRGDKGVRAQSMRAFVATRGLWMSKNLLERHALEAELLAFPRGRHDDMHDALGLIGQLLDVAVHGKLPKKPELRIINGYKPMGQKNASTAKVV
jgi:phage terminase large subunit-like protein